MCRSPGKTLSLIAALLAFPADGLAQPEPVVRALLNLDATLEGTYGDEGADVSRRFDALTDALAKWDRATPVEPVDDRDSPVTAYLRLTSSPIDDASRVGARNTLLRAVQDVIRGTRTQSPSRFQRAESIDPSSPPRFPLARYAAVFAGAVRGQVDETIGRMKEAVVKDPLIIDPASRSDAMRQAAASLRRGSLRDAMTAFEALAKSSPGSSEAHRMLATAAAIAGDTTKSIGQFEAALRIRPDDERSWLALASIQVEGGKVPDAVRTLQKATAAIPESGRLRWELAGLLAKLGRGDEALAQYSETERVTPVAGRATVHQAVATSATLQQDIGRAVTAAQARVRASLNDAGAHRDLASLYIKEDRQDEAFAELAIAAVLDPDDALTLLALGQGFMADRRDEDAVAALERAVSLQPNLRDARYALAQALTRASKRADAERHLAEFERQRAAAVARERRALEIAAIKEDAAMKSAAGQHRQAVQSLEKVVSLEPDVAQNYLDLAEALVKAGRPAESLPHFVKAAELNGVAEVHLRLADVLGRLGRARESNLARETYERLRLADFRRRSGS